MARFVAGARGLQDGRQATYFSAGQLLQERPPPIFETLSKMFKHGVALAARLQIRLQNTKLKETWRRWSSRISSGS